jgi:hypothetical protein
MYTLIPEQEEIKKTPFFAVVGIVSTLTPPPPLITQVKHLPARREEAKTKIDGREVAITVFAAVAI